MAVLVFSTNFGSRATHTHTNHTNQIRPRSANPTDLEHRVYLRYP